MLSRSVLIIGIDGQIGSCLQRTLVKNNFDVFGTTRKNENVNSKTFFFDLADPKINLPLSQFDSVVICAGISEIQKCEQEAQECKKINVTNTIKLINSCAAHNCFIIFLSSNTVFDGSKPFYNVDAETNPKTNYGKFKLEVELYLKINYSSSSILRVTKVVTDKARFIEHWNKECVEGRKILAFTNRLLSPAPISTVVESIILLVDREISGLFHVGADEEISYYDYAKKFFVGNKKALSLLTPVLDPSLSDKPLMYNSLLTHLPKK
jgi:dTDP-4-dehydrorhamnose reductase